MIRTRLIPCLLLDENCHLVKTTRFASRKYLGDPLNAAYVFSGYQVDELILLDIDASLAGRSISLDFVDTLARFVRVPLAVGGGIGSLLDIQSLLSVGVERVILGSVLKEEFAFLRRAVNRFGSSTVSVLINATRDFDGSLVGYFGIQGRSDARPLMELASACEASGAGEIVVYDVDREGTLSGFDLHLYKSLNDALTVPLVALGGCGSEQHIQELVEATTISGIGAGSLFVYAPNTREVLLNYPYTNSELRKQLDCMFVKI